MDLRAGVLQVCQMLSRFSEAPPEALDAAFKSIGKLIVAANDVDLALTAPLGAVIDIGENSREIVLHSISFAQKCALLRAILKLHPKDISKPILEFINTIEKLQKTRDIAAHGVLFYENGHFILMQVSLTKILTPEARSGARQRVDDLERVTDELLAASALAIRVVEDVEEKRRKSVPKAP